MSTGRAAKRDKENVHPNRKQPRVRGGNKFSEMVMMPERKEPLRREPLRQMQMVQPPLEDFELEPELDDEPQQSRNSMRMFRSQRGPRRTQ